MKIKFIITLLIFVVATSASYASFPVKRAVINTENSVTEKETSNEVIIAVPATSAKKDKWVAAALWFVLGGFAAHRWYLGSPWYWNVLYIITFGFVLVGHIIDIVEILIGSYPGL